MQFCSLSSRQYPSLSKILLFVSIVSSLCLAAEKPASYVRVNQSGYEFGKGPHRAYWMTDLRNASGDFRVIDSSGSIVYSNPVGSYLGQWSRGANLTYRIYALDFRVPASGRFTIAVSGAAPAESPEFAVDRPEVLYSGLLLNTKFFYETQRDGPHYIPNALRSAPGHLNDRVAEVFETPSLDENDNIDTVNKPLKPTGSFVNADGGWWDAGDYMKYVETVSYTVALQEIGVRDFPDQMGPGASFHPPAPPLARSYSGDAAGAPGSSDFSGEARFGIAFLFRMWDSKSRTLYYQVGNSQDWNNFNLLSDYDIWRLPQADDTWNGCDASARFICHRPVFAAGPAGSRISPNLAGRLAADFAVCYQLNYNRDPALANRCLQNAEQIFDLADTSFADPAASVDSGTCKRGCLLTIIPFDGYGETVWDDDMELGAAELSLALRLADSHRIKLPSDLPHCSPGFYSTKGVHFASRYIDKIYKTGQADTLNLYDVSALAHFELYRALSAADHAEEETSISAARMRSQLLLQVDDAVNAAKSDAWGFGTSWSADTASRGTGLAVMASEAFYLTGRPEYDRFSQRWMANILGANAWGSTFIVGAGSKTFPNCIQHQVANIAGAVNGSSGGTPVLWGAVTEGPASAATSGLLDGMVPCPSDDSDPFAIFDGNNGPYDPSQLAVYVDNVQSYSTTEPAIDLSSSSFLMWSWRMAGQPATDFR